MVKTNLKKAIAATKVPNPLKTERRTFLTRLWAGLGVLAILELIAVGFHFLRRGKANRTEHDRAVRISCGSTDRYQPGTITPFVRGRFYLARLDDGGFLALSRKCTHLGCTVPWVPAQKRFICPCHASAFDIGGQVIHSPASRALDIYPLAIENNLIRVDIQRAIQRRDHQSNYVVYPDKS